MRRRNWRVVLCAVGLALVASLVASEVGAVLAQAPAGGDHPEQYPAELVAAGAPLYAINCASCHSLTGTGVGGIDLGHGVLPRARTDAAMQAVIATGFPQAGMPAFRLAPADVAAIIAFVRVGLAAGGDATPVQLGDAARGRALFEGKGKCLDCHRVGDTGGFAGPDLTNVTRTPVALRRLLLDPSGSMFPINRPVRAVTRDGKIVTGRRLNEDTYTVQLITDQGRLVSFVKAELREWSVGTTSLMPPYKDVFSPTELADVLAFVVSLKGQRP